MENIRYLYQDKIGYVQLLDIMGHQFTPAEDARISTGKGSLGPEKDGQLQVRLLKDVHSSPFEGVILKFELCVPIFVLRELDRHRTVKKSADGDLDEIITSEELGRVFFARNEMSGRYIKLPDLYFFPHKIRAQSKTNQQGGEGLIKPETAEEFIERGRALTAQARELYNWAVANGIEKGQARIFNTYNNYVKIRLTGSLKNWFDFLKLRLPADVQEECQLAAAAIETFIAEKFPQPWETWRNYVYEAVSFTKEEVEVLKRYLNKSSIHVDSSGQAHSIYNKLNLKLEVLEDGQEKKE